MKTFFKIIFAVVCLSLFGCVTAQDRNGPTVYGTLKQLKIGMTQSEVVSTIGGQPDQINPSTTESGRHEQWIYSGATIIRYIRGPGTMMRYSFALGTTGKQDKTFYLYFDNGILTSTQGF
jgi:outer membrane protein assembly factor BamE (lipoprotein component of BamABCDE complex)